MMLEEDLGIRSNSGYFGTFLMSDSLAMGTHGTYQANIESGI
jgi:hypothetical protein